MHLPRFLKLGTVIGSAVALLFTGSPSALAQTAAITTANPYTLLGSAIPSAGTAAAGPNICKNVYTTMAPTLCNITINISDQGFEFPSYYMATNAGVFGGNVTFKNTGTKVHTATAVPGSGGWGMNLISWNDGNGNTFVCAQMLTNNSCKTGVLDTGGMNPGGSATYNVFLRGHFDPAGVGAGKNVNSVYTFTSATDCLNGNSNPQFNCTPSQLTAISAGNPNNGTSISTQDGSVFDVPGSPSCAAGVPTLIFSAGPPACLRQNGTGHLTVVGPNAYGTVADPKAKPVSGVITVTIDDINGFQPTDVTVTGGSTIHWVNNGQRVHSINFAQGGGTYSVATPGQPLQTLFKTLGPGETADFNFACGLAFPINTCTYTAQYSSRTADDLIPAQFDGNAYTTGSPNIGNCNLKAADANCGRSGMQGTIFVVPPPGYDPSQVGF